MRKHLVLLAVFLLALFPSLTFVGTTYAAPSSNPLDACSGTYATTVAGATTTTAIYRGMLALLNGTNAPVDMAVTFHATKGTMSAQYHAMTGTDLNTVQEASSPIPFSATSGGPGVTDTTFLLTDGKQSANSAIILVFSSDASGVLNYTGGSIELWDGGILTRNTSVNAEAASFSFAQEFETNSAPFVSRYYTLTGTTVSSTFSNYTPEKSSLPPAGGGATWALKLQDDKVAASSAMGSRFCGGDTTAALGANCTFGAFHDVIVNASQPFSGPVPPFTLAEWGPQSSNRMILLWYPNGGNLPVGFDGAIWNYNTDAANAQACLNEQLKSFVFTSVQTINGPVSGGGSIVCAKGNPFDLIINSTHPWGGGALQKYTLLQWGPQSARRKTLEWFPNGGSLPGGFEGAMWVYITTPQDAEACRQSQLQFFLDATATTTH